MRTKQIPYSHRLAYILKIEHSRHDYFLLSSTISISSLVSRRSDADMHLISSIINGSWDAPDLLSGIYFCIRSYSRNYSFSMSHLILPIVVLIIFNTGCVGMKIQWTLFFNFQISILVLWPYLIELVQLNCNFNFNQIFSSIPLYYFYVYNVHINCILFYI